MDQRTNLLKKYTDDNQCFFKETLIILDLKNTWSNVVQSIQSNPPILDLEVKHGGKLVSLTIQGLLE